MCVFVLITGKVDLKYFNHAQMCLKVGCSQKHQVLQFQCTAYGDSVRTRESDFHKYTWPCTCYTKHPQHISLHLCMAFLHSNAIWKHLDRYTKRKLTMDIVAIIHCVVLTRYSLSNCSESVTKLEFWENVQSKFVFFCCINFLHGISP